MREVNDFTWSITSQHFKFSYGGYRPITSQHFKISYGHERGTWTMHHVWCMKEGSRFDS